MEFGNFRLRGLHIPLGWFASTVLRVLHLPLKWFAHSAPVVLIFRSGGLHPPLAPTSITAPDHLLGGHEGTGRSFHQ